MEEVQVAPRDPEGLRGVTLPGQFDEFAGRFEEVRSRLGDRIVWNVNSTDSGGGVAEMLKVLLPYARGGGIDARWLVIAGDPSFFRLTKRLHHALHGASGDHGPLDVDEHDVYREVAERNAESLAAAVRPGDIVIAHDPQTAGLLPGLRDLGTRAVWRCHIGAEDPNERTELGWRFLSEYLAAAEACVFTRPTYVPTALDLANVVIIPPSIDPLAPKNADLDDVDAVLRVIGLRAGSEDDVAAYRRSDGTVSHVRRRARFVRGEGQLPGGSRYVAQVSRWDPLKDMEGVMTAFADALDLFPDTHLALVGPEVAGVADDPEGEEVLDHCAQVWDTLPPRAQERVHLVCLPMVDGDENSTMVNAIQRGAAVVVQKSLAEGFGLTVAEAMWKSRPVVASARGGIRDQVVDGENGVLVDDPTDLDAFASALAGLLTDEPRARRLGEAARERVRGSFLPSRHLLQWADVLDALVGG